MSGVRAPRPPRPEAARPVEPPPADPARLRAAYRSWVRAHHPDRGGDPAAFAAGLGAWRRALSDADGRGAATASLTFHRTRPFAPWTSAWWTDRRRARSAPPRVR